LYEALKKLTILALGPMTNIATLIQNHPDIIPQIEKNARLLFNPGNGKLNVFLHTMSTPQYLILPFHLCLPVMKLVQGYLLLGG
jgi:hypothetical protein